VAISWLTALKAVPWTDVVQAAPQIVKGARSLFATVRQGTADDKQNHGAAASAASSMPELAARVDEVTAALRTVQAEQQTSADLIRSLAEQNAQLVAAIAIIRARVRLLLGICLALAVSVGAIAVWLAMR
jgi:uncharacterized phage infection (PIP) family protein YhgE